MYSAPFASRETFIIPVIAEADSLTGESQHMCSVVATKASSYSELYVVKQRRLFPRTDFPIALRTSCHTCVWGPAEGGVSPQFPPSLSPVCRTFGNNRKRYGCKNEARLRDCFTPQWSEKQAERSAAPSRCASLPTCGWSAGLSGLFTDQSLLIKGHLFIPDRFLHGGDGRQHRGAPAG